MAKGDIYNNSAHIQGNGTTVSIQPSGSSKLCLYWMTAADGRAAVYQATGYNSTTDQQVGYATLGAAPQNYRPQMVSGNMKLILDNTHYIVIKGYSGSSNHYAYWLSGIYLA